MEETTRWTAQNTAFVVDADPEVLPTVDDGGLMTGSTTLVKLLQIVVCGLIA